MRREPAAEVASRTDWEIVREFLASRARDYNTTFHVDSRNPELKDRVNCVNAMVANARRERRLKVAPPGKTMPMGTQSGISTVRIACAHIRAMR